MYQRLEQRLQTIHSQRLHDYLRESRTGLEKESLRVNSEGRLSQTLHPAVLGSALTHPWITTDYAESLMELITPPQARSSQALDFLMDVESFVYQHLPDELLWTTSMPCILGGPDDIRISEYGSSNAGRMKHIYRQGLAARYGKTMQVIAGIHFNYSISEDFWPVWHTIESDATSSLRDFTDLQYMALTRNLLRYGWLVIYLLGTSPAICKSFLGGRTPPPGMREFNQHTLYEPYGTSLRMGNIGYTNSKEHDTGVDVRYDSLESYTEGLRTAISTPCPEYEAMGVKVDGEYRQLNANILQIENEYYSTVRPKQPLQGFEKPINALRDRGIRYIELRSADVNAFHPSGITRRQLAFLETFMHFCLLQDSPLISPEERRMIDRNQALVAHRGREPGLELQRTGTPITLRNWADELLQQMQPVAELLDQVHGDVLYTDAVQHQLELVQHPDMTPSAHLLEEMQNDPDGSFFAFAQRKSAEHRSFFMRRTLSADLENQLRTQAETSLSQQQQIERQDKMTLDTFLERYFTGKL